MQGRPIIICNQDDEETKRLAYKFIEVPRSVDCLQGILSVIPMQLLSYHIATIRGFDVRVFFLFHCSIVHFFQCDFKVLLFICQCDFTVLLFIL